MASATYSIYQARRYHAFIDGLRAIAILTVVGSHAGVPFFEGGYIGVDVFFVISGYLIINHIIEDIDGGRFSFFGFFARRTFRILPVFLLVTICTTVLATTILVPDEPKKFANSVFLSAIMAANHYFLAHQGYFDMAAFTKPLLHMWSLAVEEQFYLVAPAILLGLAAVTTRMPVTRRRTAWIGIVATLAIVSFAICVAFTFPVGRANVSFYIMPARGWEFILGGAAPFFASGLRRAPAWACEAVAAAGLGAIVFAMLAFDADTIYPSYFATIPVIGATAIIACGLAKPDNFVARGLSNHYMVAIGLVSYSWYLWHWPLIYSVRVVNLGQPHLVPDLAAVLFSLALAGLTYRFFERPIREFRLRCPISPRSVVVTGAIACIAVGGLGYYWSWRIAPRMLPQLTGLEAIPTDTTVGAPVRHRGMIVGDSHALVIAKQLQRYAAHSGAALDDATMIGCLPLIGVSIRDARGRSATYCQSFLGAHSFDGQDFVVMLARWNYYLGLPPSDPYFRSASFAPEDAPGKSIDPYALLAERLDATLQAARQAGVRRILLIGPTPEFPWYAPYCVIRGLRLGRDICTIPRGLVDIRRQRTLAVLRDVAARFDIVRFLDPIDVFCSASICRANSGSTMHFFDLTHLSPAGMERLYDRYHSDFQWALNGGGTATNARSGR